jgi:hypothetical protein
MVRCLGNGTFCTAPGFDKSTRHFTTIALGGSEGVREARGLCAEKRPTVQRCRAHE